jgi:hypothetical protein
MGLRKNSKQSASVDGVLFTAPYKTASPQSAETPGLLQELDDAWLAAHFVEHTAGVNGALLSSREEASAEGSRPWANASSLQSMDREPTALRGRGTGRAWLEERGELLVAMGEKKGRRRGSFNSGALGCWAAHRGQQRKAGAVEKGCSKLLAGARARPWERRGKEEGEPAGGDGRARLHADMELAIWSSGRGRPWLLGELGMEKLLAAVMREEEGAPCSCMLGRRGGRREGAGPWLAEGRSSCRQPCTRRESNGQGESRGALGQGPARGGRRLGRHGEEGSRAPCALGKKVLLRVGEEDREAVAAGNC